MIRIQLFCLLTLILSGIHSVGFAQNKKFDPNQVNLLVNEFIKTSGVTGVAISLVNQGKHEERFYGTLGGTSSSPVNRETLFEIGSITKVFTPHLMLVAQKEGKLSIQDPVAKHLPELQKNPAFLQITLKDLATHTSSLPSIFEAPDHFKSRQEVIQWLAQWKPAVPPKTKYSYSNVGIALIGFVLEEIYHQPWDKLLQEKVLLPRKMTSTVHHLPPSRKMFVAQGVDKNLKPAGLLDENWVFYPAGILKTTAGDLGAYLASLPNDPVFHHAIHEAVCFSNHDCQGLGIEARPLSGLSQTESNVKMTTDSSLNPAVMPNEKLPAYRDLLIDKTGSSDGMSTYIAMIPSKQIGIVILCNKWNVGARVALGRKILASVL